MVDLYLCAQNVTTITMGSVLLSATTARNLAIWPVIIEVQLLLLTTSALGAIQRVVTYFEYGVQGHYKKYCPKLKNKNRGNQARNGEARARAYVVGNAGINSDSNVVTGSNNRHESRLNIISCTKTQKYLLKRCHVFLAHITAKKAEDKSEDKRLEDVPIVRDFPEVFPKDLSGLSGNYRRFIEGFSKIAKSMTKLTQKNVKFDWGNKEEAAFQLLKQKLCSAPILALPEGAKNFIIYCDALHRRLGAVVFALKIWRPYMYGTKCTVFTDHKSLQHILDQKELNMRKRRLLELLSDYDSKIRYHPRKANIVADALSRKEQIKPLRVRALVMTIGLDLPKEILNAQTEARKPKNFEVEDVGGMIREEKLEPRADGTLHLKNRIFTYKEEMDLETAQTSTTAKLPLLKQGKYEMWKLRIEQYFQVQDYALWDVIKNGNSFKPIAQTTTNDEGTSTTLVPGPVTADEKTQKKNDVKAR
ncbi:putative reverse transcriptase domain-containing protein, partial [Tanacetum coccineum]